MKRNKISSKRKSDALQKDPVGAGRDFSFSLGYRKTGCPIDLSIKKNPLRVLITLSPHENLWTAQLIRGTI